jgi:hypothetical protein
MAIDEPDPTGVDVELVDAGEIARRLGLRHRNVVLDWRFHRFHFPPPVTRRRSYLWDWRDVAKWAQVHATELAAHQVPGTPEVPAHPSG